MTATKSNEIRRVKTGNKVQYFRGEEKLDFPSVTTIIGAVVNKPLLVIWAKNEALRLVSEQLKSISGKNVMIDDVFIDTLVTAAKRRPDELKDTAADLGTRVHEAIDLLLSGDVPVVTDDIRPAVTAARMWMAEAKPIVVSREFSMLSEKLQVTGTLDFLGKDKDGLFVADYKTTGRNKRAKEGEDHAGVYKEQAYQLGAYAYLYEEVTGKKVNRGRIFWINKEEPEFLVREVEDFNRYKNGFPAMVDVYNGLNSVKFLRGETYASGL